MLGNSDAGLAAKGSVGDVRHLVCSPRRLRVEVLLAPDAETRRRRRADGIPNEGDRRSNAGREKEGKELPASSPVRDAQSGIGLNSPTFTVACQRIRALHELHDELSVHLRL